MIRYALTTLILSGLALPARAQDTDLPDGKALLAKCVQTLGGADKLRRIETAVIQGKADIPEFGLNGTLKVSYRKGQVRAVADFNGTTTTQGVTDSKGWEISPTRGPRLMSDVETEELLGSVNWSQYTDPDKHYSQVTTVGKVDQEGESCYHLRLVRKTDGGKNDLYLSAKTLLPVTSTTMRNTEFGDIQVVSKMSDYKAIGGIKTPMKTSSRMEKLGMTYNVQFSSIEYDVDIDDKVFDVPVEVQKLLSN